MLHILYNKCGSRGPEHPPECMQARCGGMASSVVHTQQAPAGKGNAQRNHRERKGPRGGENRAGRAGVCFVEAVQTGSDDDGTFPSDARGGGDTCEDGTGGSMREESIVRKHLSGKGKGVTEKLTKCK